MSNSAVGKAKQLLQANPDFDGDNLPLIKELLVEIDHLRTQDTTSRGRVRDLKDEFANLKEELYKLRKLFENAHSQDRNMRHHFDNLDEMISNIDTIHSK